MSQTPRTKVFISYSHSDKEHLERLQVHLKPLERSGRVDLWDDTELCPGQKWATEIQKAIDRAKVAILLISADFLYSEFIHEVELPQLLSAAENRGIVIMPVILKPSRFSDTPILSEFQTVNDPLTPLLEMSEIEQEKIWVELSQKVESHLPLDTLSPVRESFISASTPPPNFQKGFPEACDFDLEELIKACLKQLWSRKGLVGLVIPCCEDAFRVRFCDRLVKQLGRRNIKLRDSLQLDPWISVDEAVARIERYKKDLLRHRNVICPVSVSIFDKDSTVPDRFWQALTEDFQDIQEQYQLILFMYGRETAIFPQGVPRIQPPQFHPVDVHQWVLDITRIFGWSEQILERWKQRMITDCRLDAECEFLDIQLVYDYLEMSLNLLRQQPQADEFLHRLEQECSDVET